MGPAPASTTSLIGLLSAVVCALLAHCVHARLSESHYATACPNAASKVNEVVKSWIARDRTLAPALLRLHFHDCFVRGCDASVLLDSTPTNRGEKEASGNADSLRGFEVIEDVKSQVEAMCPGIVSCADIVALAARDAIQSFGGANWSVPLGRRDGVFASAVEANRSLPSTSTNFHSMARHFASKGLSARDMIVLSGAHTVGVARCSSIQSRLYTFSPSQATDPALHPSFAKRLKRQCKFGDTVTRIKMDQTKPTDTWDYNFYSNVLRGKALFQSDDVVKRTPAGLKLVRSVNKRGSPFNKEFARSMVKMGRIGVLAGTAGQIRRKCNVVNS